MMVPPHLAVPPAIVVAAAPSIMAHVAAIAIAHVPIAHITVACDLVGRSPVAHVALVNAGAIARHAIMLLRRRVGNIGMLALGDSTRN